MHDELVLEIPKAQASDLAALVCEEMSAYALVVDVRTGENWDDMTPLAIAGAGAPGARSAAHA